VGKLPRKGLDWIEVLRRVRLLRSRIPDHFHGFVGSMTTVPLPIARIAFLEMQEINANDIATFSEIRELEVETIEAMGEILGCSNCTGMITSGGTEANIAALYLAREHGYETVYYSPVTHDSIPKAIHLLRMKGIEVPHRGFRIDVDELRRACKVHGEGVVVATVGTTGFGTIDPIEEIEEVAEECGLVIHIDAAFGGFVAPYLYPNRRLGFENAHVVSATMDPHKLGLAPIPAGGLIVRSEEWFEPLVFEARYMPAGKQIGLLGTRSAGSIVASWASIMSMGLEGYRELAHELMKRTRILIDSVRRLGLEPAIEPEVPVVCIAFDRDAELLEALRRRGYHLYLCGLVRGVRIVVMPHLTLDSIKDLTRAFDEALTDLRCAPHQRS